MDKNKLKLFLKGKEETKKLNKEFQKASKSKQRVMIAEDVILQLKLNKFSGKSGTYLTTNKNVLQDNESLQDILLVPDVKCEVCAIGGAFASCIRIKNEFILDGNFTISSYLQEGQSMGDNPMRNVLEEYFSDNQLELIEDVFENRYNGENNSDKISNFYNKYPDDTDRLKAIMKNIVKNKGTFKL